MHAKPCFYCIILLGTLFLSSCYWQPISLDTPLSKPWSENITTFGQALNASLSPSYSGPLPSIIHPIDRCWCDFSAGSFLEPFNVTHWEVSSVNRLKDRLERQQLAGSSNTSNRTQVEEADATMIQTIPDSTPTDQSNYIFKAANLWSLFKTRSEEVPNLPETEPISENKIPPRSEYDLRPYGIELLVDFGFSGSD